MKKAKYEEKNTACSHLYMESKKAKIIKQSTMTVPWGGQGMGDIDQNIQSVLYRWASSGYLRDSRGITVAYGAFEIC